MNNRQKLSKSVVELLGKLPQVETVDITPCFDINIKLNTRDRQARDTVFERELQIHDAFPDLLIDFRVTLPLNDSEAE